MVKHTQIIRWQKPMNCLSAFDHFVGLVLKGSKGLKLILFQEPNYSHTKVIPTEVFVEEPHTVIMSELCPDIWFTVFQQELIQKSNEFWDQIKKITSEWINFGANQQIYKKINKFTKLWLIQEQIRKFFSNILSRLNLSHSLKRSTTSFKHS